MKRTIAKVAGVLLLLFVGASLISAYHSTETVQRGYPGTGMEQIAKRSTLDPKLKANQAPAPFPPASHDGPLAAQAYKNVQVLGHLSTGEMTRLMTAVTTWVAPQQGCAYCHVAKGKDDEGNLIADEDKLWSDDLYTKKVARRMFQMTMHINSDWQAHVQQTGVTCYTCHRGQPVPQYVWYQHSETTQGLLGDNAGKNQPSPAAGYTSLPADPYTPFLREELNPRVQSTTALPEGNRSSIKQTEWTYGLMISMSQGLGVNCTYCHNSRSMGDWSASPAARATAWHGIRLSRDLNNNYLVPLHDTLPAERLGPEGDAPKVNCATCHQGAYKPLLGANMLKDYMVLAEAKPQPQVTPGSNPVQPPPAPGPAATPPPPGAPQTQPPVTPTPGPTPAPQIPEQQKKQ